MHVMLDLETFGTTPGSALRSIGAVAFEPRGLTFGDYYANISRASCEEAGLTVDPSTEKWWAEQEKAAQVALDENQRPLGEVAQEFHAWFRRVGGRFVWCQGANFDEPLWSAACRAAGIATMPWKFWDTRCTRTAYALAGLDPRTIPRGGTAHNALEDARYQVQCVWASYKRLTPTP